MQFWGHRNKMLDCRIGLTAVAYPDADERGLHFRNIVVVVVVVVVVL